MQRSARLEWLQARLGRSAEPMTRLQLCEELQITPRMLARDPATLMAEGTPVIGDAHRGYLLHLAHAAPLPRFNVDERRVLTLGLQGFIGPRDPVQEDARRKTQAKLLAAMTMDDRAQSLYLALWQADEVNPHHA
jgi:predicted DNA-binding transcriptional regulator YafY